MTIHKIGSETRVNITTANDQHSSSVAALADGGWVVTWSSLEQDGNGAGIYQQRFDRNGNATSIADRLVNVTTTGDQYEPSVTALADGGWVVTWTSWGQDGDNSGIYQQRFDRNGNPTSAADRLVNTTTTNEQSLPSVAVLADGGWVVTWSSFGQDGDNSGIYQQRFDPNGNPTSAADRLVNATTANGQLVSRATALADGGWVVTWTSFGQDGDGAGIYQQRFDRNGDPASNVDQPVNITTAGNQMLSSVTALADGGWVVTWISDRQDGDQFGIYQQRFDRNGNAASNADRLVNVTTADAQYHPSVTALADGGWVVTWLSQDESGNDKVYLQAFDRNGVAASATDVLVGTTSSELVPGAVPDVTALADGGWVVTWASKQDGNFNVYQQRFMLEKAPHDVTLSANSVQEGAAAGTLVGVVTGHDVNLISGDQLTYTLLGNADGRFTLSGNQILVADGFRLDFEQQASHTVKVQVKDRAGNTFAKDLTINVTDVYQEITAGSVANDVFKSGAAADQLSGNAGNDRLFSGAGNDILKGEAGHDVLGGGEGKDKLTGGKGKLSQDAFLFDTKLTDAKGKPSKSLANKSKDQILDFGAKYDSIWFDDAAFTNKTIAKYLNGKGASLDKPVKMKAGFFKKGERATDKDDFFIYNERTKKLYFDVDGSGSKAMVEIASLKLQKGEGTTLTHKDFFFV